MDVKYTNLKDALIAVSKNGLEIKYCSIELICNIEVLKAAIKQNYFALKEIKNIINPSNNKLVICDRELMFELIKENVKVFRDTGSPLKKDKEIVLFVVKKDGSLLKEADINMQNDKEVLITALSNSIFAISGAKINEELKNDKEVALLILRYRNNRLNITWLGDNLKKEITDALGYDILKEPNNPTVIKQVETYLKCVINGKEFEKPENPFKEETIVKEEIKKEQPKVLVKEENEIKEEKKDNLKNVNIEEELRKLNTIKDALEKNIRKTEELEKELKIVKETNEQLTEELNRHVNKIKSLVLELKK